MKQQDLEEGWVKDVNGMFLYQGFLYIPEVIWTKLIRRHHNNPLSSHFGIDKVQELIVRKYYWPTPRHNVESYIKNYDVYLASKAMKYKLYGDLQSLLVPTHWWKDLSRDYVTRLLISTNWKGETYDSILVIVNRLIKMVHYESVKITIDASELAEVINNVVVRHHVFPD